MAFISAPYVPRIAAFFDQFKSTTTILTPYPAEDPSRFPYGATSASSIVSFLDRYKTTTSTTTQADTANTSGSFYGNLFGSKTGTTSTGTTSGSSTSSITSFFDRFKTTSLTIPASTTNSTGSFYSNLFGTSSRTLTSNTRVTTSGILPTSWSSKTTQVVDVNKIVQNMAAFNSGSEVQIANPVQNNQSKSIMNLVAVNH